MSDQYADTQSISVETSLEGHGLQKERNAFGSQEWLTGYMCAKHVASSAGITQPGI